VFIAAFTLLYGISDTASAPFFGMGASRSVDGGGIGQLVEPAISDFHGNVISSSVVDPSATGIVVTEMDGSVRVEMGRSDIYRGSLVLINQEYACEFPDERELVDIAGFKTPSYRVSDSALSLSGSISEPLNAMMDAFFAETGSDAVTVISAFRDYDRQMEILNEYIALVGGNEAYKWVAVPGHSEHHSGLAVDFGVHSGDAPRTFSGTGVYEWFGQNCDKYGFILRYPDDKTDITNTTHEPWHFRYVGVPHAHFIHKMGLCLEEYIDFLMGFSQDEPYCDEFDGRGFEVFFTRDREIVLPSSCEYEISGNNFDGFIVTVKG